MSSLLYMSYSKDSFHRFGDDLCELLLSYLTINQKIHYESVCKQWQSLVFNKQKILIISLLSNGNSTEDNINYEKITKLLIKRKFVENFESDVCFINESLLEKLLKKFKFIKEIVINLNSNLEITTNVLKIIRKNCNYLEKLLLNNIYFQDLSETQIEKFGQKLGQKLKAIEILFTTNQNVDEFYIKNNKHLEMLLNFTPNVRSFDCIDIKQIISKPNNYFKKLEEINFQFLFDSKSLETFTDYYFKQINKFSFHLSLHFSGIQINNSLKQLSRFQSLTEVQVFIDLDFNNNITIDKDLTLIANKCTKLNKLDLTVTSTHQKVISDDWFAILGLFTTLKVCKFSLINNHFEDNNKHYGSIQSLKHCKHLKHLMLNMKQLEDNNLENIHLFLPQLKSFRIYTNNCVITDQTLHYLSQIKDLEVLEIIDLKLNANLNEVNNTSHITDAGIEDMIKNASLIRNIVLNCNLNITSQTIETFFNRANNNPKVEHNFQFKYESNSNLNDYIIDSLDRLPDNLKLKFL